jgi:hypothetical protein
MEVILITANCSKGPDVMLPSSREKEIVKYGTALIGPDQ